MAMVAVTIHTVAIKKFKEADEDSTVHRGIQREIRMLKLLRSEYVIDLKEAFRRYFRW